MSITNATSQWSTSLWLLMTVEWCCNSHFLEFCQWFHCVKILLQSWCFSFWLILFWVIIFEVLGIFRASSVWFRILVLQFLWYMVFSISYMVSIWCWQKAEGFSISYIYFIVSIPHMSFCSSPFGVFPLAIPMKFTRLLRVYEWFACCFFRNIFRIKKLVALI